MRSVPDEVPDRLSPRTILIVDDDPGVRGVLADALGLHGYHIVQAGNGAEALEVVREQHVDLVLLDLLMPVMDGWEFARALLELPNGAIPVIGFSALLELPRSPVPPFVGFLRKPIRMATLLEAIRGTERGA